MLQFCKIGFGMTWWQLAAGLAPRIADATGEERGPQAGRLNEGGNWPLFPSPGTPGEDQGGGETCDAAMQPPPHSSPGVPGEDERADWDGHGA